MSQFGDSAYLGAAAAAAGAASHRSMSPPTHYTGTSSENALMYNQQPPRSGPTTGSDTSGSQYPASDSHPDAGAMGLHSPTSSTSHPLPPVRSAKEQEAMMQRYGRTGVMNLGLATQHEEAAGVGVGVDGQGSGARDEVVVHSDGGRVNPEETHEGPTEIPPAYDSIPTDDRR